MIKKYILTISFLMLSFLTSRGQLPLNQKAYADSLANVLKHNKSDSLKARACFNLSHYYTNTNDNKRAAIYLERGREMARPYPYLQAISCFFESELYLIDDTVKSRRAVIRGDQLLSRYAAKEAYLFRSKLWYNTAIIAQNNDDTKAVVSILLNKVIPLVKKSGNTLMLAKYYSQAAMVLMNSHQFEKAKIYYNLAIEKAGNISGKSTILLSTYILAASNFIYLQQLPEAKMVLDKAKAILAKYPESSKWPDYYYSEGNYFEETHQYKSALVSYNNGIAIGNTLQQSYDVQILLLQKYSALTKLKDYKGAQHLLDSLSGAKEFMGIANNRRSLYEQQAKNNVRLGNYRKAYHWLELHGQLNDSLYKSKLDKEINALEVKFRNAEAKNRISELTAANQKVTLESRNTRLTSWLLGVITISLTIILVTGYFFYRSEKKLKELNYQQELKSLHQQHQIKCTQAMLQGQDEERQRVARDLHDGLGGMLSVVRIKLCDCAGNKSLNNCTGLEPTIQLLDESITELRNVARNIMPVSLLELSLEASLNDLCRSFTSGKLNIDFQCMGIMNTIPLDEQVSIYRIIQELLNNAAKHADAKHVLLQCSQYEENFMITIEDDGKGFDTQSLNNKKGLGIRNIQTRVDYLNGYFDLQSAADGTGTAINIEIKVSSASITQVV